MNPEWTKSSLCQKTSCVEARWVQSSECSMGTCVQARMVKSSACTYGDCVEARFCEGHVELRDTKTAGVVLDISFEDWQAFITGVKQNEFDLPTVKIEGQP